MSTPSVTYHSLAGKVVVVTGGAGGIGAATVEHFALQGCTVVFLDIDVTAAQKTIERVVALFEKVPESRRSCLTAPKFYECDVTDLPGIQRIVDHILQQWPVVHILVNNAAAPGKVARIETAKVTPEDWEYNINANLRHIFFFTKAFLPSMKAAGGGSIVNLGSITWRISAADTPVYGACKAAIMGLTRTHSKEFGPYNIRVNSVMPGAIATERQRAEVLTSEYRAYVMRNQSLQRDLEPSEVANIIVFLASDQASGVTGSSYVVDGGWTSDP
ncbi:putative galactose dehydrogenase GalD [Cyphellophora attinorum]|uniref:Putative galactose dehydrogenase GalD n=1 Tax=Cyphellophora attinorum TaxID=1664694 RepID=A0A0N0NL22_9EURO|nr:putative galactose dehydrogenase GalD [Phialophora attinorum]KPI38529.1 putative galactose dehydrogenase GalD [Phialophora attinorum]